MSTLSARYSYGKFTCLARNLKSDASHLLHRPTHPAWLQRVLGHASRIMQQLKLSTSHSHSARQIHWHFVTPKDARDILIRTCTTQTRRSNAQAHPATCRCSSCCPAVLASFVAPPRAHRLSRRATRSAHADPLSIATATDLDP